MNTYPELCPHPKEFMDSRSRTEYDYDGNGNMVAWRTFYSHTCGVCGAKW